MMMKKQYYSAGFSSNKTVTRNNEQLMLLNRTLLLLLLTMTWTLTTSAFMAGVVEAQVKLPPGIVIPALFAFGNSVLDTGNNNYRLSIGKADYSPYGKDFMGGNMPNGRFSNGRIPTDLLADAIGIKKYVPPYLHPNLTHEELLTGVCFASAGAGLDPLTSDLLTAIPWTGQLDLFKNYMETLKSMVGENQTSSIISNALYVIVLGSDDIAVTYSDTMIRKIGYDDNSYTDFLVNKASTLIQELYGLGGRRFAVAGVPPLGCVPLQRTLGGGWRRQCEAKLNQVVQLFNPKLANEIRVLKDNLAGSRPVYLDTYDIMMDIIDNPSKYGLDVIDKGCCGTGLLEVAELCNRFDPVCPDDTKYLFWDSFHPTETGYHILVNSLVDLILKGISE